jgi:hypothetical protein
MSELFIIFLLAVSSLPSTITFFVLGGCLHAFAIVLYDWGRETINGPKALDEQLHHHATGH